MQIGLYLDLPFLNRLLSFNLFILRITRLCSFRRSSVQTYVIASLSRIVSEDSLYLPGCLLIVCTEQIVRLSPTVGYSDIPAYSEIYYRATHLLEKRLAIVIHPQWEYCRTKGGRTDLGCSKAEVRHQRQSTDRRIDHVSQHHAGHHLTILVGYNHHNRLRATGRAKRQVTLLDSFQRLWVTKDVSGLCTTSHQEVIKRLNVKRTGRVAVGAGTESCRNLRLHTIEAVGVGRSVALD